MPDHPPEHLPERWGSGYYTGTSAEKMERLLDHLRQMTMTPEQMRNVEELIRAESKVPKVAAPRVGDRYVHFQEPCTFELILATTVKRAVPAGDFGRRVVDRMVAAFVIQGRGYKDGVYLEEKAVKTAEHVAKMVENGWWVKLEEEDE